MKRFLILLPLLLLVLSAFSYAPTTHARTTRQDVPMLQRHTPAKPADCSGGGCEGLSPPPFNACANNQPYESWAINANTDTETLYLYGGNCGAFWAAIYFNCAANCTGDTRTVTALGVWETGCDGSNRGALDTLPVTLSNSHHWESTYMIASDDSGCGGSNFHAAAYANNISGGAQQLFNTATWFQ